jgi:hypothetical protein
MGSVNSVNPGAAGLLELVSKAVSPSLSSAFSSDAVQSALQAASPEDLVNLSEAALQAQVAGGLFANPETPQGTSSTPTDPAALLLQAVESSIRGSTKPLSPEATVALAAAFKAEPSSWFG